MRHAPHAAGADVRAPSKPREHVRHGDGIPVCRAVTGKNNPVPRILPRQARRHRQPIWQLDGQVLRAVHGEVSVAAQERVFELLDELALAVVTGDGAPAATDRRSS